MAWNLKELRETIKAKEANSERALQVVDSLDRSVAIFRFHALNARDALINVLDIDNPQSIDNVKTILGDTGSREELSRAMLSGEAHLISSFLTTQSIADYTSQLLNILVLKGRIAIHECSVQKVFDSLPDSEIQQKMNAILSCDDFRYVSDFCNVSKHRYMVKQKTTLSMEEDRLDAKVSKFSYRGRDHAECWGRDALERVISVKNSLIRLCGAASAKYCSGEVAVLPT